MTQVSRNLLTKKVAERIFEILIEVVASLNKPVEIQYFLEDLLSSTEKVMLGKRLAIAYLLLKEYDQRSICNILKVSLTTVSRVNHNIQTKGKGYKGVLKKVFAKEKLNEILDKLDTFFVELIPPSKGTDWRRARQEYYAEKRQTKKPF